MNLPQNPIFIVGYPRSGTTLLQRILAVHPGVYTFPETHYFCVIEKKIQWGRTTDRKSISPDSLPVIFENIAEKMEFRFTSAEQDSLQKQAAGQTLTSKALFEFIVKRYLLTLHPEIENVSSFRWIEKTPNHAHHLERIIAMYPQVQVLHILRHPVPAIYSRKLKFPFNKETPVSELARRWNRMLSDVENFRKKYPNHILTLRYEDLIRDMDEKLNVAGFLKMQFDKNAVDRMKQKPANSIEPFILPSEIWKLDDLNMNMDVTNNNYQNFIGSVDTLAIEEITMEYMRRYGYESLGKG